MAEPQQFAQDANGQKYVWKNNDWVPYSPGIIERFRDEPREAASQMHDKAQEEMYKATGPEAEGKGFFNRAGHAMKSGMYGIAGAGQTALAGATSMLTDPKQLGVAASGAIHPAIPFSVFGAQAAQGAQQAIKEPTPENVESGLLGMGMMATGAKEVAEEPKLQGKGSLALKGIDRIKKGSYSDVISEFEKAAERNIEAFRKRGESKGKYPTPEKALDAETAFPAARERLNMEWDDFYKGIKGEPTDALAIRDALKKAAELDPQVRNWLEQNIKESASGGSVTAPNLGDLRRVSSDLNKAIMSTEEDATRGVFIEAHTKLENIVKAAADRQGKGQQYRQVYALNRKLENIIYKTGVKPDPIKPSPLWGLGGLTLGAFVLGELGSKLGVSEAMGGAFGGGYAGRAIGTAIGKAKTPPGSFNVRPEIQAAESAWWKRLGEEPPKEGALKKKYRPAEDKLTDFKFNKPKAKASQQKPGSGRATP